MIVIKKQIGLIVENKYPLLGYIIYVNIVEKLSFVKMKY